MMIRSLLAVSALFAAQPAQAGWKSGNDLLKYCEEAEKRTGSGIDFGVCHGYIQGVIDGSAISVLSGGTDKAIKVPAGVNSKQLVDIVVTYLRANPEVRHYVASDLVYIALKRAFPGD